MSWTRYVTEYRGIMVTVGLAVVVLVVGGVVRGRRDGAAEVAPVAPADSLRTVIPAPVLTTDVDPAADRWVRETDRDDGAAEAATEEPVESTSFEVSSEKPRLLDFVKPDYPEMARRARLEGTVVVKVLVGPDGRVMDAAVLKSVHPLLDNAALAAARKTVWTPGKARGVPVKSWMALPYNFTLK